MEKEKKKSPTYFEMKKSVKDLNLEIVRLNEEFKKKEDIYVTTINDLEQEIFDKTSSYENQIKNLMQMLDNERAYNRRPFWKKLFGIR